MRKAEVIKRSVFLITEYYQGNLEPFFGTIAEDVLWIGPRGGQVLEGRDNVMAAWASTGDIGLTFTMGDIEAKAISTSANSLEVLLEYYVYTHFPDGAVDEHHQRLQFSWGSRREDGRLVPKVFMIHISNVADDADTFPSGQGKEVKVYASSPSDSRIDAVRSANAFPRLLFHTVRAKGANEMTYFLNTAAITWVESADEGRHAIVHTSEGSYRTMERLAHFMEEAHGMLLRVHASHLVNPMHVRSVTRFSLTLDDGTTLPIPQKRYTRVKRELEQWRMPN